MGLQVCKLVLFDTLIWQSNGDGLHLLVVPVLGVNVLGEPPDEKGMLEQAPVRPVPWDRIVWIVGNEDEPEIKHELQFHISMCRYSQGVQKGTSWEMLGVFGQLIFGFGPGGSMNQLYKTQICIA